ncbi:MAG: hypothetical protein Q7U71_09170 [bacterium]|nr:hypothetical protein [bacterium]
MKKLTILLITGLCCCSLAQAQKYYLADKSYWQCSTDGQLLHVFPESTVTVQTTAKGFAFTAIHFEKLNERYGWAGGNDVNGYVTIKRTIDGGKTWVSVMLPAMPIGDRVERIQSVKGQLLYVLLRSGKYLRSHDWGYTFMPAATPVEGTTFKEAKQRFEEAIRYWEESLP